MYIFEKINIKHRKKFEEYFENNNYDNSEFAFTYLFMWADIVDTSFVEINEQLCISAKWYGNDKIYYLFPIGNKEKLGDTIDFITTGWDDFTTPVFRYLTSSMIEQIEAIRPGIFNYRDAKDTDDYVYLSSDLIELKGKKYHSKRNHIKNFCLEYPDYKYSNYDISMEKACLEAVDIWFKNAQSNKDFEGLDDVELKNAYEMLNSELDVIYKMIKNYESLGCKGGILEVSNKIIAFTFGEQLNKETFVVYVEKADTVYKGAYAMINNMFCANNCREYMYINRQEDMGIEGLRKAKRSYNPVKMIQKFEAYLKK